MVYIKAWADFQDAAEALYAASPTKARYVVKFRAVDGALVLKLTDDKTCLKFKTAHSLYLGRFEALTLALAQKMANRAPAPPPAPVAATLAPPAIEAQGSQTSRAGTPAPEDATAAVGASGTVGGGTKKKKPKKKK